MIKITKRNTAKKPKIKLAELDTKMQNADPMIKQAFSEYRKEIARLQKQLVREQIAHESEKEYLLQQVEQSKKSLHITRTIVSEPLKK